MLLKYILFLCCFFFGSQVFAYGKTIAIDGYSGFVGSSLANDFEASNLKIGCHQCVAQSAVNPQIFVGDNYDPVYLRLFLKDVVTYYQVAAIASVEAKNTLEEYILSNSIGPYISSRINKSMTIIGLSTIAIRDVDRNQFVDDWIDNFVTNFSVISDDSDYLTKGYLIRKLRTFMALHPLPQLKPNQYYGLSKLLLEKLLKETAQTRSGNIYMIRPSLVIGDDIKKRRGISMVKNIMDAVFNNTKYQVWNRTNCFTPINKLKAMMHYVANTSGVFAKFEIFDSGCVAMNQHIFVNKILAEINYTNDNIELVSHSGFERNAVMLEDARLSQYYPTATDIDNAVKDMICKYRFGE
jgi:hypothetical protein